MSIKSILLHLSQDSRNAARTAAALGLAETHGAHVTALYTMSPPQLPAYVMGYVPPDLLQKYVDDARAEAAAEQVRFAAAAKARGIATEWRLEEGQPHDILARQARYADLVVIGQPEEDNQAPATADLPDELTLTSGRPVLTIPYAGEFDRIGRKILVAWNGSREGARAVHDALPLLKAADEVVVYGVNVSTADHLPGADIAQSLARHGVSVRVEHSVARDISVGDALLGALSDEGADLLVMGAYGHSRVRELALGGATRQVLRHMTAPVLMSH